MRKWPVDIDQNKLAETALAILSLTLNEGGRLFPWNSCPTPADVW
jgi:hypothetical protein